ncbi:putative secreted protein [Roseibium album]|jgi:predicted secreted protein|nr:putative secreted protein [Roseibium album]
MSVAFGLAVYFLLWWIILFAILPFGLHRTQEEAGDVVPGTEPSAPHKPKFLKVIVATTVITTIVFASYITLRESGYGLDDIPFLNPPSSKYSQPGG